MNEKRARSIGKALAMAALALTTTCLCLSNAVAEDTAEQAKIDAGQAVYNMRCAVCHGDDLVNTGQTFDLRKLKADERPRFDYSVRNGKNQMPPWKGVLSDNDIDHLWHYIRAHAYDK